MLFTFTKYTTKYNIYINLNKSSIKTATKNTGNLVVVAPRYKTLRYTPFFRKFFFRTLLLYLNYIYSNFFFSSDLNVFYFPKFMYIIVSMYHPSFFCKKVYLH